MPALASPFAYSFMDNALAAGSAAALLAGSIGWYVVVRREAFAAHTLSVMAFPGGALAALASLPIALGFYIACLLAGGLIALFGLRAGVRSGPQQSAVIGTVQAMALALGFLALSLYGGILENLEGLLFGSPLGITGSQVLVLFGLTAAILVVLLAAGRPLWFASVDRELARAAGVPTGALSALFLVLVAVAVAAAAQITGALLVFALLIAPPAAAHLLSPRPAASAAISIVLALLFTWLGLLISYYTNYPPGFVVPAVALFVYLLARLARA
ncbi:MAG TPA: metal ABC transporter permease [Solirubrobacteraceae bacterium]|nr:metal ABC transporter permease [Solirubrobacteraceae bacterium]